MTEVLSHKNTFGLAPDNMGKRKFDTPKEQRILRMIVRRKGGELRIPPELDWLREFIEEVSIENDWFIYVTVRSGEVITRTDDVWHVDGFSMRVPHPPEINYIWVDKTATEFHVGDINLPDDFDPLQHNIHHYFQDVIGEDANYTATDETIYRINPYHVHRRPPVVSGQQRTFFRVSLVPIEIEDDTCMKNPLLPTPTYNRGDIRDVLKRYPV